MTDRPVTRPTGSTDPLVRLGRLSRRDLLRSMALAAGTAGTAALLGACGGSGSKPSGPGAATTAPPAQAGSLQALAANLTQLSLLNAQSDLPVGRNRFTFGLSSPDNRLVEGGTPKV
jgi:anti-sigma factor RsiW